MITRARPPLWLAGSSRFARLSAVQAAGALAAIMLFVVLALLVPADVGQPAAAGDQTDIDLYRAIVEQVRAGGNYYAVTADLLRSGDYPLKPFLAFRLPTLAVVLATIPPLLATLLLFAVAIATGLCWVRLILQWLVRPVPRIMAILLLAGGMLAFVQGELVYFHEIWAGLLIAWALAIRREDRWVEAVALAMVAMLIRETAALFAVAMGMAALLDGRRREGIGWGAALAVFAAVIAVHARAASLIVEPLDPSSPGWSGLHGIGLFALATAKSTMLTFLPWWLGAPLAVLAMVGWLAASSAVALRAALVFGGYALVVAIFARMDNFYWVLIVAPAYLVGLAFVPDGLRDLARAILDRPRVRVQRISR